MRFRDRLHNTRTVVELNGRTWFGGFMQDEDGNLDKSHFVGMNRAARREVAKLTRKNTRNRRLKGSADGY